MANFETVEIFTSDSDAWDDSALIKAWDSTINSFKSQINAKDGSQDHTKEDKFVKPMTNGTSSKKKKRNKKKKLLNSNAWQVGEHCQAKFSEDGCYYPADIVALCDTFATVCYIDYDEEGDVMLSDLKKVSKAESSCNSDTNFPRIQHGFSPMFQVPPPPPMMHSAPPPCPVHSNQFHPQMGRPTFPGHHHGPIPQPTCPPYPFQSSNCSDEALAAMLMSWYKTGFTTGYHQALREHNIVPDSSYGSENKN